MTKEEKKEEEEEKASKRTIGKWFDETFSTVRTSLLFIGKISIAGFIIMLAANNVTSRSSVYDPLANTKKELSLYEKTMVELMQASRTGDAIIQQLVEDETKENQMLKEFLMSTKTKMVSFFDATEKTFKDLMNLQSISSEKLKKEMKVNELNSLTNIEQNIELALKNIKCGTFEFATNCLNRLKDDTIGIINNEKKKVSARL